MVLGRKDRTAVQSELMRIRR